MSSRIVVVLAKVLRVFHRRRILRASPSANGVYQHRITRQKGVDFLRRLAQTTENLQRSTSFSDAAHQRIGHNHPRGIWHSVAVVLLGARILFARLRDAWASFLRGRGT